jgi:hypothetical protein
MYNISDCRSHTCANHYNLCLVKCLEIDAWRWASQENGKHKGKGASRE